MKESEGTKRVKQRPGVQMLGLLSGGAEPTGTWANNAFIGALLSWAHGPGPKRRPQRQGNKEKGIVQ